MHDSPVRIYLENETPSIAVRFRDFLKRCSNTFPHVVYVAGNHEFYGGKWNATIQYLRDECAVYPNIHFLENNSFKLDNTIFVGGTLWTDMNRRDPFTLHAVRDMMNDFHRIRNDLAGYRPLSPADTVIRHRDTLSFIRNTIINSRERNITEQIIVVGHHCPSPLSTPEYYQNMTTMNGAFSSDLSNFILDHPEIVLWTHGHTHHPFDYTIGTTRIVCNPRGYHEGSYDEETGWDPNLTLEI